VFLTRFYEALMVASTRFRRLFTSGGGYTLFMPVLIKVYVESESHPGIKLAIEYAVNRFYALHQEAFVYQSLDIIAHVVMAPDIEGDWLAKSVYTLFNTLRRGISPTIADAAGIHDSNKVQEREALIMRTAEDKPQTFLASLRQGGNQGKDTVLVGVPEEYEAKRLGLDNFVRLFLTVIAHDPTILRAEHFMHFLRFLTPYLYNDSSSARSVLRDGIDALGVVLTKVAPKPKVAETPVLNPIGDFNFEVYSQEAVLENQLLGQSKTPSDIVAMRLDYLSTVVAFTRAGGQLGSSASQRTIDLIKLMLKDSVFENKGYIASFFSEYTKASLVREPAPSLKVVVSFLSHLAPVVSAYATTIDFSGVFDIVSQLAADVLYANEPTFSRLVATPLCAAGIGACAFAASEKMLFSIPSRPSVIRLVSGAILLRGADVIAELEKHAPSYDFLVGVVMPLVLTVKTTGDVTSDGRWADISRRDVHARTWTRLLTYVMSACQKREREAPGDVSHGPERVKSQTQDKRRSAPSSKAQMMTLVAAIQIMKAIIIRAEDDLSAYIPGIWSRLASFFKTLLADGDAKFALTLQDISAPPSPAQSPRASAASFSPYHLYDPNMPSSISSDIRSSAPANPRVVDYCLWSLFELLSLCRSPLVIQMRLFLQEKVAILDQELHYHQDPSRHRSRRASSAIFSKPRRRMSGYFSGVPSPENSPTLSASPSFPSDPSLFHLDPSRQPGYQRFPSPGGLQGSSSGPKIVHLGPVHASSASAFRRSLSPIGGGVRLNKTAIIKSMPLVLATYRRIRLVQTWMGYGTLLPLPNLEGGVDSDDPATTKAWSKKEAMDAMVKEMKELIVEFEEPWREVEDDVVLIDADQSVTF
jgi:Protein UNC80